MTSSKELSELIEVVKLSTPKSFYLQHDGSFLLLTRKRKNVTNNIIIPRQESKCLEMIKLLVKLVRCKVAVLDKKFILTLGNRVIRKSDIVIKQLQLGGFDVKEDGVVSNKRKKFSKPYTIWEFNRMSDEMKYTSISRASSKDLINVVRNDTREVKIEEETDFVKITERLKRAERMKDPLYKKRYEAMTIINRILKGECSEEYSLINTLKTRLELLQHLGLPESGKLPKGYQLDHIRERSKHVTDDDFKVINAWWNLRLLSRQDNLMRTAP
jgi:hypothetical protein